MEKRILPQAKILDISAKKLFLKIQYPYHQSFECFTLTQVEREGRSQHQTPSHYQFSIQNEKEKDNKIERDRKKPLSKDKYGSIYKRVTNYKT